jgi:hypothetical protein
MREIQGLIEKYKRLLEQPMDRMYHEEFAREQKKIEEIGEEIKKMVRKQNRKETV